jgi:outer membrane protein assembly factor BamB
VWSSPTVDAKSATVLFGVGNCNHPDRVKRAPGVTTPALNEGTIAVDLATGAFRWQYSPRQPGNDLDLDFGATPNALGAGAVGEASKDGSYYACDARTGKLLWSAHAAAPSEIGGIIASTAVGRFANGHRAIFLDAGIPLSSGRPDVTLRDVAGDPGRAFGVHAIDAVTHKVKWHAPSGPSYGALAYSHGLVFAPNTFTNTLLVLGAETGLPLRVQPLNAFPASPPAISGRYVYLGAGVTEDAPGFDQLAHSGGVWAFTPTVLSL